MLDKCICYHLGVLYYVDVEIPSGRVLALFDTAVVEADERIERRLVSNCLEYGQSTHENCQHCGDYQPGEEILL